MSEGACIIYRHSRVPGPGGAAISFKKVLGLKKLSKDKMQLEIDKMNREEKNKEVSYECEFVKYL